MLLLLIKIFILLRHIVYGTQSTVSANSNMADKNHEKTRDRVRNEVSSDRNRERSRSKSRDRHNKVFFSRLVVIKALYNDFLCHYQ